MKFLTIVHVNRTRLLQEALESFSEVPIAALFASPLNLRVAVSEPSELRGTRGYEAMRMSSTDDVLGGGPISFPMLRLRWGKKGSVSVVH